MAKKTKSSNKPIDLDGLNFNNITHLISTDTKGLSAAEIEARHHTLMDRLLAKQLARIAH